MGNGPEHPEIRSYRDLVAWQRAFALGVSVYRLTRAFPDHERFGLISQLRRGGVSVASNIAEGYGRGSRADYVRFLKVARGALFEVETQLLFARELEYASHEQLEPVTKQVNDTARVLSGLITSLDGEA
jgi:four helix bundle protein